MTWAESWAADQDWGGPAEKLVAIGIGRMMVDGELALDRDVGAIATFAEISVPRLLRVLARLKRRDRITRQKINGQWGWAFCDPEGGFLLHMGEH